MSNLKDLREALDEVTPHCQSIVNFKKLFSAFKVEYDGQVHLNRKQLSDKRDIEVLWVKWIHARDNSKMKLNDVEGFNGFVLGYELRNKELLEGSGEPLNLALAFTDVKKKKGSGSDKPK